jgi:hypothetical protein
MSVYKYKIGDFVKIIKPKHICFGNVGRVLKITKASLTIRGDENCDDEFVTISKKYVEIYNNALPPKMRIIPLTKNGKEKQGLDYYMKKAFLPEDFDDFVLFNYMRTQDFTNRGEPIINEYTQLKKKKMLDMKIKDKKIVGGSVMFQSCVFFTPIPTKFFKKYLTKELIENYSKPDKYIFICLDTKILCNIPKNYWVGINSHFSQGPNGKLLYDSINEKNIFYALDSCETKPELNRSFLEFFIEQLADRIEINYLQLLLVEKDSGLTIYLEPKNEDKFINFLREKGAELLLGWRGGSGMELFACPANWMDKVKTTLRFKKEDLLIANYKKDTVEENIKRVLGL